MVVDTWNRGGGESKQVDEVGLAGIVGIPSRARVITAYGMVVQKRLETTHRMGEDAGNCAGVNPQAG